MYTYRPEANKTRKVKGAIDKTLNIVGEEMIPNFLNPAYNYKWETPTETISLQGVYKDPTTYVNVWVYTKQLKEATQRIAFALERLPDP